MAQKNVKGMEWRGISCSARPAFRRWTATRTESLTRKNADAFFRNGSVAEFFQDSLQRREAELRYFENAGSLAGVRNRFRVFPVADGKAGCIRKAAELCLGKAEGFPQCENVGRADLRPEFSFPVFAEHSGDNSFQISGFPFQLADRVKVPDHSGKQRCKHGTGPD